MWKDITGFEGRYEVSDAGEVRNARTKYALTPMRTGTKRPGSQRSKVRLSSNPRRDFDVAHLVLEAFVGPRPVGHVVLHTNDDSTDNRVANLKWGTHKDNAVDAARKGRSPKQKLSVAAVSDIRSRRAAGESGVTVAALYGVSQQRVCDVFKGRTAL